MSKKISEMTVSQLMWSIIWWIVKTSVFLFLLWLLLMFILG